MAPPTPFFPAEPPAPPVPSVFTPPTPAPAPVAPVAPAPAAFTPPVEAPAPPPVLEVPSFQPPVAAAPSEPATSVLPQPPVPPVAPPVPTPAPPQPGTVLQLRVSGRSDIPVDGQLVLGRNPLPLSDAPQARAEALPDPTRSLSRSHVLVTPLPDSIGLTVKDLGSTNGTWILDGDKTSRRLAAGESGVVPAGGLLLLGGDVTVEVIG